MNCRHCLRAEQTAVWRSFTPGCNPCELRRIAYMTGEERERYLDRVQHLSGYSARQRVSGAIRTRWGSRRAPSWTGVKRRSEDMAATKRAKPRGANSD